MLKKISQTQYLVDKGTRVHCEAKEPRIGIFKVMEA